jgi:hypothetical protein
LLILQRAKKSIVVFVTEAQDEEAGSSAITAGDQLQVRDREDGQAHVPARAAAQRLSEELLERQAAVPAPAAGASADQGQPDEQEPRAEEVQPGDDQRALPRHRGLQGFAFIKNKLAEHAQQTEKIKTLQMKINQLQLRVKKQEKVLLLSHSLKKMDYVSF